MVYIHKDFKAHYLEAANNIDSATKFWNTYNSKPFDLLNTYQYWQLRTRLFELLNVCKNIDADAFNNIHKGHPYYFIGISSFLLDDFQTAVYFFDAAVTEDMNSGADPKNNPKPSTRFLMLEGEANDHAAKNLVALAKAKVERALEYYQANITKERDIPNLDLEKTRNNFIYYALTTAKKPGLRTLATVFITFFIEWDFRKDHFEYGVKKGTSEPFFSHLFRGCVLFESLVMHNPTVPIRGKNLGSILTQAEILAALKIDGIKGKGGGDSHTLDDVFEELHKYTNTINQTIQITYMVRNTLGHNLGWDSSINQEQYQKLYFIIASSCLHVIADLWKRPAESSDEE